MGASHWILNKEASAEKFSKEKLEAFPRLTKQKIYDAYVAYCAERKMTPRPWGGFWARANPQVYQLGGRFGQRWNGRVIKSVRDATVHGVRLK